MNINGIRSVHDDLSLYPARSSEGYSKKVKF